MKFLYISTLFFFLVSLGAAIPVPSSGSNDGNGDQPPRLDKGKGRAVDPPSQPPSRPNTPTPEHDPTVPLPGRTKKYTHLNTHSNTPVVTMYYGDDHLPEHMGHLQRNQAEFPHNRNPLPLAAKGDNNRRKALHNIPGASPHPVTGLRRVRDEKMPNMLHNPHHATSTTVEYLDRKESQREGGRLTGFKNAITEAGPNARGQLRANPGLLSLHPDQRRGHEAPARLNTQTLADGSPFKKPPPDKGVPTRPRKRRPTKKPVQVSGSNFRPGHVVPAGHIWKPSTGKSRASHFGAPGHLQEAEHRYPPRPQNHKHYMKQLNEKKDAEAKYKKAASESHKVPSKHLPKQTPNLKKFEKKVGPARHGNGAGRAHEAPARMQMHVNHPPPPPHSAPPTRPPSRHEHQLRPSSPQPPSRPHSPPHGSGSKPGASKRK
ncbi:hypothetical protein BDZ97DRAFT_1922588 [Flammula alnicola]|nr:hypothetical protein BDZ97DRAFT_1922588 [Flammula alnicola]